MVSDEHVIGPLAARLSDARAAGGTPVSARPDRTRPRPVPL
jgi:hypothetical protein